MSASPRPAHAAPNHERPTSTNVLQPATYVMLPRRLLEDLRDSPAAIGIYSLIGRLFLVTGKPVHLSAGDLEAYDPHLSYGAGRRALDRLVATGFLQRQAEVGEKFTYLPTWGRVNGVLVPWDRAAPQLGCPRHIHTIRLDDQFLDVCIGRMRPHPHHRAMIERYMTEPLLSLRDVGAYTLALLGLQVKSPNLQHLHLIDAYNRPKPLPDTYTILAFITQSSTNSLTMAGWKRLGIPLTHPEPFQGQAMFFAAKEMIGTVLDIEIGLKDDKPISLAQASDQVIAPMIDQMIADPIAGMIADPIAGVIGLIDPEREAFSPLECVKTALEQLRPGSYGDHGEVPIDRVDRESTTTVCAKSVSACEEQLGGGGDKTVLSRAIPTEDAATLAEMDYSAAQEHMFVCAEIMAVAGASSALPSVGEEATPVVSQGAPDVASAPAVAEAGCGGSSGPVVAEAGCGGSSAPAVAEAGCGGSSAPAVAEAGCGGSSGPAVAEASCGGSSGPAVAEAGCGGSSGPAVAEQRQGPAPASPRKRYGLIAKPAAPAPVYRPPVAPDEPTSSTGAERAPEPAQSDTPSAKRLRQLGVRADVAAQLGKRTLEQVERVIAQAENQQGIRDRAAWVVSALRALPESEEQPAAPKKVSERAILLHPKLSGYERMRWLNRFRSADPAKRPEILREFFELYPLEHDHASTA